MLNNREYSQIVTALFYASNGKDVPLAAINSLLRMHTRNPGNVTFDHENKILAISEPTPTNFFSRLWPTGLFR